MEKSMEFAGMDFGRMRIMGCRRLRKVGSEESSRECA